MANNIYKATIEISKKEIKKINRYLDNPTKKKNCLDEDETITYTAKFPNGYSMDIKCCGVEFDEDSDNSAWTEAVLFDSNGKQVTCSEPSDEFEGEWELIDFEHYDIYQVDVVVQKNKNKPKNTNSYYALTCVVEREIQVPKLFTHFEDAIAQMRKEFIEALEITDEEFTAIYCDEDDEKYGETEHDSEFNLSNAWINDLHHCNYDWEIHEITLPEISISQE